MAEFDVMADNAMKIDFGVTGNDEILQNVAMILNSVVYSCPMNRAFAYEGSLLDRPIQVVQSLFSSRLMAAINKYEPRAQVVSITYQGDAVNGLIKPKVRVRING
jgi:phage baseplate assembly protein W